jgi:hypothetical protein
MPYRQADTEVEYTLYQHPAGPVAEVQVSVYLDDEGVGYAHHLDLADPEQHDVYQSLVTEDEVRVIFHDKHGERLTKQLPNWESRRGLDVVRGADALLRVVPPEHRDFQKALEFAMIEMDPA